MEEIDAQVRTRAVQTLMRWQQEASKSGQTQRACAKQVAELAGDYYRNLVAAGVPTELAGRLTEQWHQTQHTRANIQHILVPVPETMLADLVH